MGITKSKKLWLYLLLIIIVIVVTGCDKPVDENTVSVQHDMLGTVNAWKQSITDGDYNLLTKLIDPAGFDSIQLYPESTTTIQFTAEQISDYQKIWSNMESIELIDLTGMSTHDIYVSADYHFKYNQTPYDVTEESGTIIFTLRQIDAKWYISRIERTINLFDSDFVMDDAEKDLIKDQIGKFNSALILENDEQLKATTTIDEEGLIWGFYYEDITYLYNNSQTFFAEFKSNLGVQGITNIITGQETNMGGSYDPSDGTDLIYILYPSTIEYVSSTEDSTLGYILKKIGGQWKVSNVTQFTVPTSSQTLKMIMDEK